MDYVDNNNLTEFKKESKATDLKLVVDNQDRFDCINMVWIDRIFERMHETFEYYWRERIKQSGMTERELKTRWYKNLRCYKKSAVKRAMIKISSREYFDTYPPTLQQMHSLCKTQPEDLGFPSTEQAFLMFSSKKHKQSPPVYHATIRVDGYTTRQLPIKEAKRIFTEAYRQVIKEIDEGNMELCTIPAPAMLPNLSNDIDIKFTELEGQENHLDKIFEILGSSRSKR